MASTPTPAHLKHIAPDKYIFYTHPTSPYTHRVHIALKYLNVPYEAVDVDLEKPREDWYSQVNPLGQVPALSLPATDDRQLRSTLAESIIIVTYLADAFPKPTFFPLQASPDGSQTSGPLLRARMSLFVESFLKPAVRGKATAAVYAFMDTEKMNEQLGQFVKGVKGLEWALGREEGGGRYFGGSTEITFVEAILAPILLRLQSYISRKIFPPSLADSLRDEAPLFWAWMQALCSDPAILDGWDEERVYVYLAAGMEKKKKELEMSK